MKKFKSIAAALLLLAGLFTAGLTTTATAQTFDPYAQLQTYPILNSSNVAATVSNIVLDTHNLVGNLMFIVTATNTAGSTPTLTFTVNSSNDQTNWTAISKIATSTYATNSSTNLLLATAQSATMTNFVPGTNFTATTAASFTTGFGNAQFAFPVSASSGRFLNVVATIGGTSTPTYIVNMFMVARNNQSD